MKFKVTRILAVATLVIMIGCQLTNKKMERTDQELKELGLDISNKAFAQLSSNLMHAIEQEGVVGAISYCQVNAYPIVDSVAQAHGVTIKRVSNLNRNPDNAPNDIELNLITAFANQESSNSSGDTLLNLADGSKLYARPILLQAPCLKCHGVVGKDIVSEDYEVIKRAYPEDKAVGYSPGDFRGLWVIRF